GPDSAMTEDGHSDPAGDAGADVVHQPDQLDGGSTDGSEPVEDAPSHDAMIVDAPVEAAPVCASAETCNGLDDNCNGTADEGCPSSITCEYSADRRLLGDSPGGSRSYDSFCDTTEILVGIRATMGSWLGDVQAICRAYSLGTDTSSKPYQYSIG